MKEFFATMTFPRGVILVSLLASIGLGVLVYKRRTRLAEIERELAATPKVIKEIQQLGIEFTNLKEVAGGEIVRGEDIDFETYIRQQAGDKMVEIGQVDTTPSPPRNYQAGVEDHVFKIKPANATQRFQRSRIGNFLYKLEADSRRVKVTSLKLTPSNKRLKPGEIGDDLWTFEASITVRSKSEAQGQGG
jgi:hypothetical protein